MNSLNNAGRLTDPEKEEIVEKYQEHLNQAKVQRVFYKAQVSESKDLCASMEMGEGAANLQCTINIIYKQHKH